MQLPHQSWGGNFYVSKVSKWVPGNGSESRSKVTDVSATIRLKRKAYTVKLVTVTWPKSDESVPFMWSNAFYWKSIWMPPSTCLQSLGNVQCPVCINIFLFCFSKGAGRTIRPDLCLLFPSDPSDTFAWEPEPFVGWWQAREDEHPKGQSLWSQ